MESKTSTNHENGNGANRLLSVGWFSPENPPDLPYNLWRHEKPFIVTAKDGNVYTAFYARVSDDGETFSSVENPKWWVRQAYDVMDKKVIDIVAWTTLPTAYR
jgi:hypothetical protein